MSTSIYPALSPVKIDVLEPGEWAFARSRSDGSPYTLIMMTDQPCEENDEPHRWVLQVSGGTAGFVCSTTFSNPIAQLKGDVRIPIPISEDEPTMVGAYKPGLLYAIISRTGVKLGAQLGRGSGPCVVEIEGTNLVRRIPPDVDLQQIKQIEYRAPGDSQWHLLARIDTPLGP